MTIEIKIKLEVTDMEGDPLDWDDNQAGNVRDALEANLDWIGSCVEQAIDDSDNVTGVFTRTEVTV